MAARCAAVAAGLLGGAYPAVAAPAKKAPTAGQMLDNATLTGKVKAALLADKVAPGLTINVDSNHGVVTLSGQVDTATQKARAVQVAKKIAGVSKVVNKLTVKGKA
jgi:hyperosmotically inducible protein